LLAYDENRRNKMDKATRRPVVHAPDNPVCNRVRFAVWIKGSLGHQTLPYEKLKKEVKDVEVG
jgi:hypothetical protein